jgi:drug/metabolite transporter (DMT)-like permease
MSALTQPLRVPTRLDLALMVITSLIWASGFIAIRVAGPETGPVWLAAIRVGIGFLVLLPYAIWRGMVWPDGRGQWGLIVGMALLNVVVPFILVAWAGKTTDAGQQHPASGGKRDWVCGRRRRGRTTVSIIDCKVGQARRVAIVRR